MRLKPGLLILLLLLAPALSGCFQDDTYREKLKWQVSLDRDKKLPYGTWLAYHSLRYCFPDAHLETLPGNFRFNHMDPKMKYNYEGHNLLILQGLSFYVSDDEWLALKQFINNGNEVVIFCSTLDSKIEKELQCFKKRTSEETDILIDKKQEQENQHLLRAVGIPFTTFGYEGRSLQSYFSLSQDTANSPTDTNTNYFSSFPDTLGYAGDQPDFIRYRLGEGHLTLHAAPLVLSNYFLLQEGNENYLGAIWKTLPDNITQVYWIDYFHRRVESANLSLLFGFPSTRLALLLAIAVLLLYVLFEGKRKQPKIPVIPPLRNDSVSFVETVGRLYYNKGNHNNLAHKMIHQYLEWVRTHYFLNTNLLNEQFIQQLTIKSGQPEATVRGLLDMIHEIKLGTAYMDDAYLYQLYNTIQLFYKNNRK